VCLAKYPHRIRPNRISVYRKSVNKQTKEGQFRWMEVNQKGSRIMSEAIRAWRIWPRAADVRRRVASQGQQRAPPARPPRLPERPYFKLHRWASTRHGDWGWRGGRLASGGEKNGSGRDEGRWKSSWTRAWSLFSF
jgi:hypothetical protein